MNKNNNELNYFSFPPNTVIWGDDEVQYTTNHTQSFSFTCPDDYALSYMHPQDTSITTNFPGYDFKCRQIFAMEDCASFDDPSMCIGKVEINGGDSAGTAFEFYTEQHVEISGKALISFFLCFFFDFLFFRFGSIEEKLYFEAEYETGGRTVPVEMNVVPGSLRKTPTAYYVSFVIPQSFTVGTVVLAKLFRSPLDGETFFLRNGNVQLSPLPFYLYL